MIPTSKEMELPILKYLEDGTPKTSKSLRESMCELFHISEEDKTIRLPTGTAFLYANRMGWTMTSLKNLGYIESPGRGEWQITQIGKNALKDLTGMATVRKSNTSGGPLAEDGEPKSFADYYDGLTLNYKNLNDLVKNDLLQSVENLDARQFEILISNLFKKMGYNTEVTQATRDGGFDVLASDDNLGLDKIYIQAKHYNRQRKVPVEEVHRIQGIVSKKMARRE